MAKKKVLIVDDKEDFLKIISSRLIANNYEVIVASNGQEGLKKALSKMPDLIFLDMMMPVMDGIETLKRLKQNENIQDVPVIMLTAKSDTKSILITQEIGAVDYFMKPFKSEEFLGLIKKYI